MFWRARVKLAASYAAAIALTVLVIGVVVYYVVRQSLDHEINSSIQTSATQLLNEDARDRALLSGLGGQALGPGIPGSTNPDSNADHAPVITGLATDVFFVVTDASGAVTSNPRQVDTASIHFNQLMAGATAGSVWHDVRANGSHYRISTTLMPPLEGTSSPFYLSVGRSLDSRDSQLNTLFWILLSGGAIAVVLSGAGGLWLAGRALSPIRESVETQRRFLSDVSHELRTPIAVIRANNELLLRHPDSTVEANLDQVEAVAVESEHMTRMVDDLLTLARADEGRLALEREPVDFGAVADDVARDMAAIAELHGIEISRECSAVGVQGDARRLRQLVLILIDNALKYTPSGGRVTVTCRRERGKAIFAVEDTGPGIPQDDQKRIFDRFFRAEKSRSRGLGGTGLGLPIARRIAEGHGGQISVTSLPGKGSTFRVQLPVDSEGRPAGVTGSAPRVRDGESAKTG